MIEIIELSYGVFSLLLGMACAGVLAIIFSLIVIIMFGRLIRIQFQMWTLAKKGFIEVDHVREDNVIKVYYLRPSEDHFEFDKGVYLLQKDALSKRAEYIKRVDKDFLSKDSTKVDAKEKEEMAELLKNSKDWIYNIDSVTLKWGIPCIFYYGKDPNPVNFRDRTKIYDSKVFAAYVQRILLNKEWKLARMALIIGIVAICLSLILAIGYYGSVTKNASNLEKCETMLNESFTSYQVLVNGSICGIKTPIPI
jgi:hypothetical protein